MSKSVLVIDTPETCGNCPFCKGWNVCKIMKCLKGEKIISIYTVDRQMFEEGKPGWCPLKEIPQKYEPAGMNFERGWNACINKILRGSEG